MYRVPRVPMLLCSITPLFAIRNAEFSHFHAASTHTYSKAITLSLIFIPPDRFMDRKPIADLRVFVL
jgi:hypothetical protein